MMHGAAQTFEIYRELINAHDFRQLEDRVIDPKISCVFGNVVHRGRDPVREAFERAWAALPDERYEMTDPEWVAIGSDVAAVLFRYVFEGTGRHGQRVVGRGRGTNIYRLTESGWRLVHEHLSADPADAEG